MLKKQVEEFSKLPLAESKVTFIAFWMSLIGGSIGGGWWIYSTCFPPEVTVEMPAVEAEMDRILKEREK